MKDRRALVVGFILVLLGTIFLFRLLSGEDNWICQDGTWVKHGNPSGPVPTGICKDGEQIIPQKGEDNLNMINPASGYCREQGGTWERYQETAGEIGLCRFADGTVCEEWKFFRNECQKGQAKTPDVSHSYRGTIVQTNTGYLFKDETAVEYQLKLPDNATKDLKERLLTEIKGNETVTIVATETPPLSKILILKSFLEK